MFVFARLPPELSVYIHETLMVVRLVRAFRVHRMRHTRHARWPELRRLLATALGDAAMFDTLQRCARVRAEWRTEPESWLHTVGVTADVARTIHDEVAGGVLWRWPCTK